MLKKFVWWFICFGFSYLVADVFHWTDQGRAFMYIKLGTSVAIMAVLILILLIAGIAARAKLVTSGISLVLVFYIAAEIAITLFATWGATKLFNVDFFITYEIMTFGACLATSTKAQSKKTYEHDHEYY